MKERCAHTEEHGTKTFKCHLLTEERRQEIFQSVRVDSNGEQPRWNWYAQHIKEVGALSFFFITLSTRKLIVNHYGKLLIRWHLAKHFTLQASYSVSSTIAVPPLPTKHSVC